MDESVVTLRIEDTEDGYVVAFAAGGSLVSVELPLDALDVSALAAFADDAAEGLVTLAEAEQWGDELYRLLVGERPWAEAFTQELEQDQLVHVRFDIGSALHNVLWELMYHEGFLALLPRVRMSRVGLEQATTRPLDQPLRIIVLTPNLADRESDQEADTIFKVVSPVQREGLVVAHEIRYRELHPLTRIKRCDVLHVIGHADELSSYRSRLKALCLRAKPSVVYFSASRGGAELDERSNLMSALQQEAGVPIVVGLHEVTAASSYMTLAAEFYRGLISGLPTAAAVARARRQLARVAARSRHGDSIFDWAGIVLYQSDGQGVAYGSVKSAQAGAAAQAQGAGSLEQPARAAAGGTSAHSTNSLPLVAPVHIQTQPGEGAGASPAGEPRELSGTGAVSMSPVALEDLVVDAEKRDAGTIDGLRAVFRGDVASEETLALLRDSLHAKDRRRQVAAVEALGMVAERQPLARDMLVDIAVQRASVGADALIRRKAVEQLGYLRDQVAKSALLLATADADQVVRQVARNALGRIGQEINVGQQLPRVKLPIKSQEASEWVAPLRQVIASAPALSPRRRIVAMRQVEALRLALIHPRPQAGHIVPLLDALAAVSPAVASLAAGLKRRMELVEPIQSQAPIPEQGGLQ